MGFRGSAGKISHLRLGGGTLRKGNFFFTLPATNSQQTHLKMDGRKTYSFLFGMAYFHGGCLLVSGRVDEEGVNESMKILVRGWMKVCCAQVFGMSHPLDLFSW